jgi:hypothetical protein
VTGNYENGRGWPAGDAGGGAQIYIAYRPESAKGGDQKIAVRTEGLNDADARQISSLLSQWGWGGTEREFPVREFRGGWKK